MLHRQPAGGVLTAQQAPHRPGIAHRLALSGPFAFVGPSKMRPTSAMDGGPRAERRERLKCGVAVVALRSGRVTAFLEFLTAVEENFDVQLLTGLRFPAVIGFQQDTIQNTFVIPRESRAP